MLTRKSSGPGSVASFETTIPWDSGTPHSQNNTSYHYYSLSVLVFCFPCRILYSFLISFILLTSPAQNCPLDFTALKVCMFPVTGIWCPGFSPRQKQQFSSLTPLLASSGVHRIPSRYPESFRLGLSGHSVKLIAHSFPVQGLGAGLNTL